MAAEGGHLAGMVDIIFDGGGAGAACRGAMGERLAFEAR
jgi:hypothetical protein